VNGVLVNQGGKGNMKAQEAVLKDTGLGRAQVPAAAIQGALGPELAQVAAVATAALRLEAESQQEHWILVVLVLLEVVVLLVVVLLAVWGGEVLRVVARWVRLSSCLISNTRSK
jgi:hypothetical protein